MKYECAFMINERGAALLWSQGASGRVLLHCHAVAETELTANSVIVELYWNLLQSSAIAWTTRVK